MRFRDGLLLLGAIFLMLIIFGVISFSDVISVFVFGLKALIALAIIAVIAFVCLLCFLWYMFRRAAKKSTIVWVNYKTIKPNSQKTGLCWEEHVKRIKIDRRFQ